MPGTRVWGVGRMTALEKDLSCVARHGKWVPFNVPRYIAWDRNPHKDAAHPHYGTCDLVHQKV